MILVYILFYNRYHFDLDASLIKDYYSHEIQDYRLDFIFCLRYKYPILQFGLVWFLCLMAYQPL